MHSSRHISSFYYYDDHCVCRYCFSSSPSHGNVMYVVQKSAFFITYFRNCRLLAHYHHHHQSVCVCADMHIWKIEEYCIGEKWLIAFHLWWCLWKILCIHIKLKLLFAMAFIIKILNRVERKWNERKIEWGRRRKT